MDFQDIPRFTQPANYQTHVAWRHLLDVLDNWRLREQPPLNLNPDFQRAHVWTVEQQIAYVEFILRGGSSGKHVLFNCKGWMADYAGPFELVDGKQRLRAVTRFLRNKAPAFGTYYQDFTGFLDLGCHFVFMVNNLPTRKQVLQWYLELNGGGTPHTEQELDRVKKLMEEA